MNEVKGEKTAGWSVWEAISIIVLVFGLGIFLPLEEAAWFKRLSEAVSPGNPLFGAIFWDTLLRALLMIGLITVIVKLVHGLSWRDVGLHLDGKQRWLLTGLTQGVLLFMGVTLISMILVALFPFELKPQAIAEVFSRANKREQMVLVFIVVSLIAPISEEMYFRGFLYPALSNRLGRIPALIIANSIFGALHLDLLRFLPITLSGIWLTLLYERTGTLYTSITAHAIWNALMVGMIFMASYLLP